MEVLISLLLIVLIAFLLTRYKGMLGGQKSNLEQKLDELSATALTDVSPDGDLVPKATASNA